MEEPYDLLRNTVLGKHFSIAIIVIIKSKPEFTIDLWKQWRNKH